MIARQQPSHDFLKRSDTTHITIADQAHGRPSSIGKSDSARLPFQGWRRFKEAFAPEIVEKAVKETEAALNTKITSILDPFIGSGTTAITAQFLGICPTGIEVNPFLADLCEAKIAKYDLSGAPSAYKDVLERVQSLRGTLMNEQLFPGAPDTFIEPGVSGRFIFSRGVAIEIAAYREAIKFIPDGNLRRLFSVILGSVVIPVSNVTVSGKGRRYRRGISGNMVSPRLVRRYFENGLLASLYDIRRYDHRACRDYTLLRGDARVQIDDCEDCDLAVFSPPYANSFDYTDVYNIELWTLGHLNGPAANRALREATLRSHVQIKRDFSANDTTSPLLASIIEPLKANRMSLWNPHIPEMIEAYISDMRQVLNKIKGKLRGRGRVYLVVGDSHYANVTVPVAEILSYEGLSLGYRCVRCENLRFMENFGQHQRQRLAESLLVFEKLD